MVTLVARKMSKLILTVIFIKEETAFFCPTAQRFAQPGDTMHDGTVECE